MLNHRSPKNSIIATHVQDRQVVLTYNMIGSHASPSHRAQGPWPCLIYLLALIAIGSISIILLEQNNVNDDKKKLSYVDTVFLVISATTNTGLNTFHILDLFPYTYIVLVLLMFLGRYNYYRFSKAARSFTYYLTHTPLHTTSSLCVLIPVIFHKREQYRLVIDKAIRQNDWKPMRGVVEIIKSVNPSLYNLPKKLIHLFNFFTPLHYLNTQGTRACP